MSLKELLIQSKEKIKNPRHWFVRGGLEQERNLALAAELEEPVMLSDRDSYWGTYPLAVQDWPWLVCAVQEVVGTDVAALDRYSHGSSFHWPHQVE